MDKLVVAVLAGGRGTRLGGAKAMVELHDGQLKLESEVGKGTTVFITFPAYRVIPSSPGNPANNELLAQRR